MRCYSSLLVTLRMRGITVWSYLGAWLAGAGVLGAVLLTAACQTNQAAVATPGSASAAPTARASAAPTDPTAATDPAAVTGPVVALGDSYTAGAMSPIETL